MMAGRESTGTAIPIAVFAFNRPKHLADTFAALARCDRLDECVVHVFCDGSRGERDDEGVAATRKVVDEWTERLAIRVTKQPKNQGLAQSIVGGVSELCDRYGRVIVLEDDLIVSPDFLDYMLQSLDRYEHEENVYQVSGYMFPVEHPDSPDAFLLPLPSTWGWATWKRAWDCFSWDIAPALLALENNATRQRFDLDDAYPYSTMLKGRATGDNDSWGILWWWTVFSGNGLVLYPRRSLVLVGGFDGSGTHCGSGSPYPQDDLAIFAQARLPLPIAFTQNVAVDDVMMERIKRFLRERKTPPLRHFLQRVKRLLFGGRVDQ